MTRIKNLTPEPCVVLFQWKQRSCRKHGLLLNRSSVSTRTNHDRFLMDIYLKHVQWFQSRWHNLQEVVYMDIDPEPSRCCHRTSETVPNTDDLRLGSERPAAAASDRQRSFKDRTGSVWTECKKQTDFKLKECFVFFFNHVCFLYDQRTMVFTKEFGLLL